MTFFGKLLAFLNLVGGVALVSWSVSLYTERPGWFDPAPTGVSPGQTPVNFAQLKDDIDAFGRAAAAASGDWGAQHKRLEGLEKTRADRQKKYAERIAWAKTGNPKDNRTGFYEPAYQAGGLLDLDDAKTPILGPDGLPLKGADVVGTSRAADVVEMLKLAAQIEAKQAEYKTVSAQVTAAELRRLKIGEIRDVVQAELFDLSTFEVNVYETRETVFRRKKQMTGRLAELK